MTDQPSETVPPAPDDSWQWKIVEIFGHRRHAGRVREEEQFGQRMCRIDVPVKGDPAANGWNSYFYGGAAIFGVHPSTEEDVMKLNKPYEPPSRARLASPDDFYEHDGDEDPDEELERAMDGTDDSGRPLAP